jgi:hypothetical protein
MSEGGPHSDIGRIVVAITTTLVVATCWWTLQAFVPEPYFMRTPGHLREMSRSLVPLFATAALEAMALGALAVCAWFSKTAKPALGYLLVAIGMAVVTLVRLTNGLGWE